MIVEEKGRGVGRELLSNLVISKLLFPLKGKSRDCEYGSNTEGEDRSGEAQGREWQRKSESCMLCI